jgi:hypothetical protein
MTTRAKLLYLIWYWRCSWLRLLFAPVHRLFEKRDPSYEGIVITGLLLSPEMKAVFEARTREALEIIKTRDPRRFRRIQREVWRIVSMSDSLGSYNRAWRQCNVDFHAFDFSTPEQALHRYCCLLVHEATHGHFDTKYISYKAERRERIERLCVKEEERFARRAFPDTWQQCFRPFDVTDWNFSWHATRLEKRARRWRRLKEMWQMRTEVPSQTAAPVQGEPGNSHIANPESPPAPSIRADGSP